MADTRILIHGSCVSRDMFSFLGPGFSLAGYTARQSLISAMTPAVELPAQPRLASAFQTRLVRDDFASSLPRTVRAAADSIDLLVLDLVDERLGVVGLPGGRFITRSQELLESGLLELLPDATPMIAFGEDAHFSVWEPAARAFLELLEETGLLGRTLLIDATFASHTDGGEPARQWWQQPAAFWNERYRRYHAVLRSAGIRTHSLGDRAVASARHRWGPSAYHYVDETYLAIAADVREMTGR